MIFAAVKCELVRLPADSTREKETQYTRLRQRQKCSFYRMSSSVSLYYDWDEASYFWFIGAAVFA